MSCDLEKMEVPVLQIYTQEQGLKHICMPMFIAALFTIAKWWGGRETNVY